MGVVATAAAALTASYLLGQAAPVTADGRLGGRSGPLHEA